MTLKWASMELGGPHEDGEFWYRGRRLVVLGNTTEEYTSVGLSAVLRKK